MNYHKNMKKHIVIAIILVGIVAIAVWQSGKLGISKPADDLQSFNSADSGAASSIVNFTLDYPRDFKVHEEDVGASGSSAEASAPQGKKYVFESSEPKRGFEITVLPFDEASPLTKERILQDIPDMPIANEKNITVGKNIPALAFESEDESIGPTFEIWFIYSGNLYEIQTYAEFGPQMTDILKTFK